MVFNGPYSFDHPHLDITCGMDEIAEYEKQKSLKSIKNSIKSEIDQESDVLQEISY